MGGFLGVGCEPSRTPAETERSARHPDQSGLIAHRQVLNSSAAAAVNIPRKSPREAGPRRSTEMSTPETPSSGGDAAGRRPSRSRAAPADPTEPRRSRSAAQQRCRPRRPGRPAAGRVGTGRRGSPEWAHSVADRALPAAGWAASPRWRSERSRCSCCWSASVPARSWCTPARATRSRCRSVGTAASGRVSAGRTVSRPSQASRASPASRVSATSRASRASGAGRASSRTSRDPARFAGGFGAATAGHHRQRRRRHHDGAHGGRFDGEGDLVVLDGDPDHEHR